MRLLGIIKLLSALLAVPFLLGKLFGKKSLSGTYLSGVLLLLGSFELICAVSVLKGWNLTKVSQAFLGVCLALVLAGAVALILQMAPRRKTDRKEWQGKEILKEALLILPAFCLVGSLFFLYAPKLESWYLVPETVVTILDTDSLHGYHPLTGQPLTPKGLGASLMNLPALYACLIRWFQIDTGVFLFQFMPLWVLLISFLVFYQFAGCFFANGRWQRVLFLWAYAFLLLFGDKAYMNEAYQMLHYAYEGRAILTGALLPYCAYLLLAAFPKLFKSKDGKSFFCFLADYVLVLVGGIFVMGIDYGLGLPIIMTILSFFIGAICLIVRIVKRRKG